MTRLAAFILIAALLLRPVSAGAQPVPADTRDATAHSVPLQSHRLTNDQAHQLRTGSSDAHPSRSPRTGEGVYGIDPSPGSMDPHAPQPSAGAAAPH